MTGVVSSLLIVLTVVTLAQCYSQVPPCGQSDSLRRKSLRGQRFGQGRIVDGTEVRDCREIPWQVRLTIHKNNGHYSRCGGSLISHRHVLTAAHCVVDLMDMSPYELVVHVSDLNTTVHDQYEVAMMVKRVTMHPEYTNISYVADVAVLTLAEAVVFDNPCVTPICLDNTFDFDDLNCTVSGWGTTSNGGTRGSEVLQKAELKTREGLYCWSEFQMWDFHYITNKKKMLCAGQRGGGKDACQGDSGGPLVCYNKRSQAFVQVGVVSFGFACGWPSFPGIYTNVQFFHQWIMETMISNS